jgi:ribonuclease P protein component
MLSSENRFHGPNSLRFVYRNGQTVHSRYFKLKYVANSRRNSPRFAIVISKKVHKSAVGRNKIRRRFYEAIRSELPRLKPAGMDIAIIVVSGEALALPFTDISTLLEQSFKEANLYK